MQPATTSRVRASEPFVPMWEAAPEEDAFFHAGGRIRAVSVRDFADLDRRTDPTVQIRRYETRRSWLVTALVALMAPLLFLAVAIGADRLAASPSGGIKRARVVEDARTELSSTAVVRAPIALQQSSELRAPRPRAARGHRFVR